MYYTISLINHNVLYHWRLLKERQNQEKRQMEHITKTQDLSMWKKEWWWWWSPLFLWGIIAVLKENVEENEEVTLNTSWSNLQANCQAQEIDGIVSWQKRNGLLQLDLCISTISRSTPYKCPTENELELVLSLPEWPMPMLIDILQHLFGSWVKFRQE